MRLLWLSIAVVCGSGAARADPGKIIVDDANKVDDKKWKPYDVRVHREERVHGEVVVLSPPLFVRGPPKGFPFKVRTRRSQQPHRYDDGRSSVHVDGTFRAARAGDHLVGDSQYHSRTQRSAAQPSGRQNRLPDFYQQDVYPRHPSYYQPGRVQGEVIVHSSPLSIKGPPKGYPLRRKTRQAPSTPQINSNSIKQINATKTANAIQTSTKTSKPAKKTPPPSPSAAPTKSSNSSTDSRNGQGTKVRPAKGRQSMMKRLKKMWPYMMIPTMMTLGYAPFVLSSIKMFVMNALMFNLFAFNAAIMLTLRNMVFGPRLGGHTKYVNYGYTHHGHGHHQHQGRHLDERR